MVIRYISNCPLRQEVHEKQPWIWHYEGRKVGPLVLYRTLGVFADETWSLEQVRRGARLRLRKQLPRANFKLSSTAIAAATRSVDSPLPFFSSR